MSTESRASRGGESIVWTIGRRLGMVLILILAFVISSVVTIYTLFRAGDTRVPNLVGRQEMDAQKIAEQAGLRVKIQHREDSGIAAGTVIETRPGPNSSVKKDSNLTIVVSAGPPAKKGELRAPSQPSPGHWFQIRRALADAGIRPACTLEGT